MTDNTTIAAQSGGDVIAADDIGGVKWQRMKLGIGADGTAVDLSPAAPMPTIAQAGTAALTSVAASATTGVVLAANANRRGGSIYNDSTALLYLAFAATASTTAHTVQLAAGDLYELPVPVYTGVIAGIWASATGSARVTELTG